MKWVKVCISGVITLALVLLLGHWWSTSLPPLGRLVSPQEGFWQNADPVEKNYSADLHLPALQDSAEVWLDERLVPHIFARNEHDLYFLQGYMTAQFRLWQMDLQVMAAAGRVSEILGPAALDFDRLQRRKGMVVGAMKTLQAMESDSLSKLVVDAYTAGVNAWISSLNYRQLPLEYKLLGYRPEPWTPLKSALLIKYMSDMLTGEVNARLNTNARKILSQADFDRIYPDFYPETAPIIPPGTSFDPPLRKPVAPAGAASMASLRHPAVFSLKNPDQANGSNDWAVSGQKTRSGFPILCNDPHLDLNLPSIWFELQMSGPGMNAYGVSLPGAPGIIIGFNDSIAWGETNAERDVKDFYKIRFRDGSRQQYQWKKGWKSSDLQIEKISIRGGKPFYDTVAYTVFGPVIYDASFPDKQSGDQGLAALWVGADGSNEGKCIYELNHARNYSDYLHALQYFESPGQNFAYADKSGNIALWEQGKFPLLWKGQGKFIMPGYDSSYLWQGYIPYAENPHLVNPARGFVSSANQQPTDSTYPYYYSGDFKGYRGERINQVLGSLHGITIQDMEQLQTDKYNSLAAQALPLMLRDLQPVNLDNSDSRFLDSLSGWDLFNQAYAIAPSLFQLWWDSLYADIWSGYLGRSGLELPVPGDNITIDLLLKDSTLHFLDHIPPVLHSLAAMDLDAFQKALAVAGNINPGRDLQWGRFQGTDIMHLAKIPAFSDMRLYTGGGENIVNDTKKTHGPSWRMIVELSSPTRAYGVYPGGESGNPGSKYYDDMIGDWALGRYYPLHIFQLNNPEDPAIQYRIRLLKN